MATTEKLRASGTTEELRDSLLEYERFLKKQKLSVVVPSEPEAVVADDDQESEKASVLAAAIAHEPAMHLMKDPAYLFLSWNQAEFAAVIHVNVVNALQTNYNLDGIAHMPNFPGGGFANDATMKGFIHNAIEHLQNIKTISVSSRQNIYEVTNPLASGASQQQAAAHIQTALARVLDLISVVPWINRRVTLKKGFGVAAPQTDLTTTGKLCNIQLFTAIDLLSYGSVM